MKRIKPAIESEKIILGAILLDNGVIRDIADKLCPKDFDVYFHEELFESMLSMHKKHGVVDIPMITDKLKLNADHESYVYELANNCVSVANVKSHADIVREKSIQRQLLAVSKNCPSIIERVIKETKKEEYVPQKEMFASFLEETAAEIRLTEVDAQYLISVLVEITKAVSGSIQVMEYE